MVVVVATNAHATVSSFDNFGMCGSSVRRISPSGFSSSRHFVDVNAKNRKEARNSTLRLRSGRATNALFTGETGSRSVLEKELEFKPTFDDYLKVMESVTTERKKQQIHESYGQGVEVDSKENEREKQTLKRNSQGAKDGAVSGGAEEDMKLRDSDESSGENQIWALHCDSVSHRASSETTGVEMAASTANSSEIMEDKRKSHKGGKTGVVFAKKQIEAEKDYNEGSDMSRSNHMRVKQGLKSKLDEFSLDLESPAFKFVEESTDVVDKPKISRMEMEERIQKLAKWLLELSFEENALVIRHLSEDLEKIWLNGADINMPEWMFSKAMRSARIKFLDHSILRLIQILGKLGNWRRVLQVIEWLQRRERFKSNRLRFIYTTALNVLGKARRPVEALNVFHAMQQQMSSYPDLVAYRSIAVTLGQAGHVKELFDVIDSMRSPPKKKFKPTVLGKWDPRLEPDIVVYNAVLNACVHRKQWEGAFWVLQQLRQQGQKPSAATYGLVMEVMFACGKYNLVHEFFRKMQKSCIPNALAYRVVVKTLWKEGKTDEAVHVVQEMEKRGIVGSAALYNDLARCLCCAGRSQEALALMKKICNVANKPLVVTYTGLIQACLNSGNIQDGAYIFYHMKEYCSPNLVTCNIMLKAYVENGMFEEAKELFNRMSQDGASISRSSDYKIRVLPDTFTFNTMLDACAAEGRWQEFECIYMRMLHHGYHFNSKRHLRMVLDAGRAGKEEVLEKTWEHLCQADRIPPAPLVKERFFTKLQNREYALAISAVCKTDSNEFHAFSKAGWLKLLQGNAHRFRDGTIARLTEDVAELIARAESPNPVIKNLLISCKELLGDHEVCL